MTPPAPARRPPCRAAALPLCRPAAPCRLTRLPGASRRRGADALSTAWEHPATLTAEQLQSQCEVRRTKGSGPGGQRRNKVETAVVVTHLGTGVAAQASERRSQEANLRVALKRLRVKLAVGYRTATEAGSHPTLLWRSRARGGRVEVSVDHDDFAALLAEALDVVAMVGFDLREAGDCLGVSATQLLKLIKKGPAGALGDLNRGRAARGLRPVV